MDIKNYFKQENIRYKALFIILLLFHTANFIIWVRNHAAYPLWDEGMHLQLILRYYNQIRFQAFNLYDILSISDYYPPFYHLSSLPLLFITGFGQVPVLYMNLFYGLIGLIFLYLVGKELKDEEFGFWVVFLFSLYFFWNFLLRITLIDSTLTVFVIAAFYFWLKSDGFKNLKFTILFGVVSGFGMLTKWSFLFFIIIPLVILLIKILNNIRKQFAAIHKKRLFVFVLWNVLFIFFLTAIFFFQWQWTFIPILMSGLFIYLVIRMVKEYSIDYKQLLNFYIFILFFIAVTFIWYGFYVFKLPLKFTGNMNIGAGEGDPAVLSIFSIIYYIVGLSTQVNILFFILFFIGLFLYFKHRKRENSDILLWVLSGYLFLTLLRNKDLRFSLPILPFIAIISLNWLEYLKEKHKVILRYIIFGAALVSFFISSYTKVNIRIKEARIPIGFFASSPPRPRNYSIEPLIKDMIKIVKKFNDSEDPGFGREKYFGYQLLLNLPRVNKTLFELEMERRRLPIYAVSYKDYYLLSDFIIRKTGFPGPKFATMKEREKLKKIKENKEEFTKYYKLVNSYQISKISKLKLFVRRDLIYKYPAVNYSKKVDRKKLTRILKQHFSEKFRINGDYWITYSNIDRKGEFLIISMWLNFIDNKTTINKMPIKYGDMLIEDMIINQDVLDREKVIMFSVKFIEIFLAPDWSNYFHSVLKKNKLIKSIEFDKRNNVFSNAKYLLYDPMEEPEINLTLKHFNIKIGVMIDVPQRHIMGSLSNAEIKTAQYCLKIKYLKIGKLFKIPAYPLNGIVYRKGRLSPLDNKPISTYISIN